MSWTRFDDNWSDRMSQLGMMFVTRVHYMGMIQFCSRTDKFTGELRLVDARRASDVDDPDGCIAELVSLGLVTRHVTRDGERYTIVEIDEHVPPPHMRDGSRKTSGKVRTARWRLHKAGDHSQCLPEKCPDAGVTGQVTRHTGTGQDGHGLQDVGQTQDDDVPGVPIPRQGDLVDLRTGELSPNTCPGCRNPRSWCSCEREGVA